MMGAGVGGGSGILGLDAHILWLSLLMLVEGSKERDNLLPAGLPLDRREGIFLLNGSLGKPGLEEVHCGAIYDDFIGL